MRVDFIKDTLEELSIPYKIIDNEYHFSALGISYWVTSKGKIGVSPSFYGKIPHVMADGSLCVSGNKDINFWDSKILIFLRTITTYGPWLFNLSANYRVAEMLSEIDFYIQVLLDKDIKLEVKDFPSDILKLKTILNPEDLWFQISTLENDIWYKIFPVELENHYVYIKRNNDNYHINYDEFSKAKMRVSGYDYNAFKEKSVFIGVGSVNSYVIKDLLSHGLNNMILIDDDIVLVDNLFRFAFPYINQKKINAVELFAKSTSSEYNIEKYDTRIDSETENYISNASKIFISVDNYVSWLSILLYLIKHLVDDVIVCLIGVDVFGGFGKSIKIKYNSKDIEAFKKKYIEFLDYTPNKKEDRKQMIGNGCGKSIAIYSEENLLKLARISRESEELGEVIHVTF